MRCTKIFIAALCLVVLTASVAFCIDPYKVNKDGFGPKIKGLQLGHKMTLLEIVSWGVTQGKLPFTMTLNREKGNNLLLEFERKGSDFKSFSVDRAEGRYVELKNFSGSLGDLLSEIEKIGFNERYFFFGSTDCIIALNNDMRITTLRFGSSDFGAQAMTIKEFAQAFINAYDIPGLDSVGREQLQHRNLSQGWQVDIYHGDKGETLVEVSPIITQTAFD